jgi:Flp pilus assembly protein TadB
VRARLTAPLVVAAALAVFTPASAAAAELRLTPVGHPRFPDRSYVLTLPAGQSVKPRQVHVTENGGPVSAPSVSAATAAPSDFGIVLVLDTSKSMTGRPIHDAFAAARALAKRRQADQPLGVVTFNSSTHVLLPLTTDAAAIDRALAEPPRLRPETHIYDGTAAAVSMLAHKKMAAGTVVVLSDGGDTGSRADLPGAAARARKSGVRVFTVGLETGSFDPDALGQLAEGAGGTYTQASQSSELARIYDQLGAELSKELLIQYGSFQGPKRRVEVEARIDGLGTATAAYHSPAMHIEAAPPYDKQDFWGSSGALFLASVLAGTLLIIGLSALLSRPERRRLRQRMAMFVSAPKRRESDDKGEHGAADKVLLAAERALARMRWWPKFNEELEIAGVEAPGAQIAILTAIGAVFFAWILAAISGSPLLAVGGLIAVPAGVSAFFKQKLQRQRKLFSEQLADNLQVIASALRAGHSFVGAFAVSTEEAPEPTKREFERVLADEKIGVPLEEGLEIVARRMDCRELEQVRLVATLQRETGGNTAEVLDRVADTVRERGELRRLISSLTAQGRMSRWIVTALPVFLILAISLLSPEYMKPLFETPAGNAMLVLAVVLITTGSLIIKRIVNIKV